MIFINVGLAGVVAYVLYRMIAGHGPIEGRKSPPATAKGYGREWLAWMVAAITLTMLTPVFSSLLYYEDPARAINKLALWVIGIAGNGTLAFVAGWIYGKWATRRTRKVN